MKNILIICGVCVLALMIVGCSANTTGNFMKSKNVSNSSALSNMTNFSFVLQEMNITLYNLNDSIWTFNKTLSNYSGKHKQNFTNSYKNLTWSYNNLTRIHLNLLNISNVTNVSRNQRNTERESGSFLNRFFQRER
tara:strand:- start:18 stop:425 length:408 start_codon:yes stop_codon:yes gene_type:complete